MSSIFPSKLDIPLTINAYIDDGFIKILIKYFQRTSSSFHQSFASGEITTDTGRLYKIIRTYF